MKELLPVVLVWCHDCVVRRAVHLWHDGVVAYYLCERCAQIRADRLFMPGCYRDPPKGPVIEPEE